MLARLVLGLLPFASAPPPGDGHLQAALSLEPASVPAGGPVRVRLSLAIDPGWHIYPVDFEGVGNKTVVEPKLPEGFRIGAFAWPKAKFIDSFGEQVRVHEGSFVVEALLAVAGSVPPGTYEIGFHLSWQACKSVCVDGAADVAAKLVVTAGGAAEPGSGASAAPPAAGAASRAASEALGGVPTETPEDYRMTVAAQLSKAGLAPGEEAIVSFDVRVDDGYHTYSPKSDPGGQIPLSVRAEGLEIVGELEGPPAKPHFDPLLKITLLEYERDVRLTQRVRAPKGGITSPPVVTLNGQVCDANSCLPPASWGFRFGVAARAAGAGEPAKPEPPKPAPRAGGDGVPTATSLGTLSLGSFLLASALGGWASLFTPCVFPMVPITVSFFSKRAKGKRGRAVALATTYALGIVATFTLIGVAVAAIFGAASLATFATNVWVNLGMGSLFVVLGLSLLGLFTIGAPSGLANRIEEAKGETKNDLVMTLLMAVAFTLASFTCTVPVLGALLGLSATGGIGRPIAGMLAYSSAFAAPFFFLALFPTVLQRMPKGGAWLEVVKVSMGLVEIAAALKFLSNADIGADTQILTRPLFLAIWIAVFLALAFYLFGMLRLPGGEGEVGAIRAMFGVGSLAFALYLLAGLFGLRYGAFLESFLPPASYGGAEVARAGGKPRAEKLVWHQSLEEGIAIAQVTKQRIFVNFTGDQ